MRSQPHQVPHPLHGTHPPNQIRTHLDSGHHAVSSSFLPLSCLVLRSESATSSDVVPPPPSGGSPNSILVSVLKCVLDSASDVQPLPLDLEAFLRDNINLDIMSGKSLSQRAVSTSRRQGMRMDRTRGSRCGSFKGVSGQIRSYIQMINSQGRKKLKRGLNQLVIYCSDRRKNGRAYSRNQQHDQRQ